MNTQDEYLIKHGSVLIELPMRAWQIVIKTMNEGIHSDSFPYELNYVGEVDEIISIISEIIDNEQVKTGFKP